MRTAATKAATSGGTFILLTLLGWASVPLFLKYFAVLRIDAWTVNGWRYAFAALTLAPFLLVATQSGQTPRRIWAMAIVPSLMNCAGQVCFALGHYKIDPGLMAFLLRFQIIFVALSAYLLFPGERRVIGSPLFWGGVLIVLAGSAATVFLGPTMPRGAAAVGVGLGLMSGVLFGCYAVAVRYFMQGISSVLSFAVISQYTAVAMIALMIWLGRARGLMPLLHMTGVEFVLLFISALVGIALGHVFYYASIARLGVAVAAGVTLLAPFVTAIASIVLYRERLTAGQWMGGVVSMVGAVMILVAQRRMAPQGMASEADEASSVTVVPSDEYPTSPGG